jgi:hypothetical protein
MCRTRSRKRVADCLPTRVLLSSAIANSSELKERPSWTSLRGVATLYQGSIACRCYLVVPTVSNSILRASVTRREASRISRETRSPFAS